MRLKVGYGVEDISLWLGCPVYHVREFVVALRKAGKLAAWWPG